MNDTNSDTIMVSLCRSEVGMDFGMVVIHVTGGRPVVSRCEAAPGGFALVPATNAVELEAQAAQVLAGHGAGLDQDGVYLCTDQLQAAAAFGPFILPADAITYGAARQVLYPEASPNTGWQRVNRDVKAGKLRVWRVGIAQETRQYVSRAEVLALLAERGASAVV
jgi:hypothetical protein